MNGFGFQCLPRLWGALRSYSQHGALRELQAVPVEGAAWETEAESPGCSPNYPPWASPREAPASVIARSSLVTLWLPISASGLAKTKTQPPLGSHFRMRTSKPWEVRHQLSRSQSQTGQIFAPGLPFTPAPSRPAPEASEQHSGAARSQRGRVNSLPSSYPCQFQS